jgi:hypothetical protein
MEADEVEVEAIEVDMEADEAVAVAVEEVRESPVTREPSIHLDLTHRLKSSLSP